MTRIWYVGGPTALIEYGETRLLTDPTFDSPGDYPIGTRKLAKTAGPAISAAEVGEVDAVLLSHDQHPDNLDAAGREYALDAPLVLSTASARERIGDPVRALANWESHDLGGVFVTGVPARHGPDGSEHLVGEVTGFVLEGEGQPTVYVSGDNASLDVVRQIAERFERIDIAVLFAGGARTPLVGDAYLTLPSEGAAEAARILNARQVVPLHFEHWAHFTQGPDTLRPAFTSAGLADRLHLLKPGEQVSFR
ncbi:MULTISPECIES: MBL fold metallo-hydrolase [Amycolatopsis]|uniref:MBL fold metallo-hydrolase n=1 Tax=Amycolatopsis dendrobii TaxID=2760662 RepID=A0A7W3VT31_9PSEU|nr:MULTISPECIES: MBL fold metallo-hydrolase [Amycolatopsis]MBB1152317.1 MBL fold metallo-hydrolase [Amycolatopsis dendrobii]UKD52435.1 MBL fold metallo-hydrolase [Amycolatopsis sp. FU40]